MALSLMTRRRIGLAAALGVPLLCVVVYTFPPGTASFYPPCLFRASTGFTCPGCGTGRGLHALLHGDLLQALAYNALMVATLPMLAVWAARAGVAALVGWPPPGSLLPPWTHRAFVVVVLAFWGGRNVPVYPCTLLGPRALPGRSAAP